jgi:hypothetical protein
MQSRAAVLGGLRSQKNAKTTKSAELRLSDHNSLERDRGTYQATQIRFVGKRFANPAVLRRHPRRPSIGDSIGGVSVHHQS